MAQHMLQRASDKGNCLVEIEIAPSSARPFWERMGFEVLEPREHYRSQLHAVRFLEMEFELGQGARGRYEISFFTRSGRFAAVPRPFAQYVGEGECLPNGDIQLPQRICCYDKTRSGEDSFVRIALNEGEVYFDKVNYPDAADLGFRTDPRGRFYVDRILRPTTSHSN